MENKRQLIPIDWTDVRFEGLKINYMGLKGNQRLVQPPEEKRDKQSRLKFQQLDQPIPKNENMMSKINNLNTPQDLTMKALIIYSDFACAAKVNSTLQNSAEKLDFTVQWNISPWRVEMMRLPPILEEALTDAVDAHLIVFAGHGALSLPFWLRHWLEHWAKCRQIADAALAVFCEEGADALSMSATVELSRFAARNGLNFIFGDSMVIVRHLIEDGFFFIENRLDKNELSMSAIHPQN